MDMIKANLFHSLDSIPPLYLQQDLHIVFVDPSWPHLSSVYRILNKLIILFPNSDVFNISFVQSLIQIASIPDVNETTQIMIFLKKYCDLHPNQLNNIISVMHSIIMKSKIAFIGPNSISVIIQLTEYLSIKNASREVNKFIVNDVYPLVVAEFLPYIKTYYTSLVMTTINNDNDMAIKLYRILLKYWPLSNGQKLTCFTSLILEIMNILLPEELTPIQKPLSLFYYTLKSDKIEAMDCLLDYFISPKSEWVYEYSSQIIKYLINILSELSIKHWSKNVKKKAQIAFREISNLDTTYKIKDGNYENEEQINDKRIQSEWSTIIMKNVTTLENRRLKLKELSNLKNN